VDTSERAEEPVMIASRGLSAAIIFAALAVVVANPVRAAGPTPGDVRISAIAFSLEANVTGVAVLVAGPNVAAAIQNAYGQAVSVCRANGGGPDCGPAAYGFEGGCSVLLYDPAPHLNHPRGLYQGASGRTIEEAVINARQVVPAINPALPPREQICA
jgi:hypothetical protein